VCGATPTVRELRRGARKPSAAEVAANPRAESARLRAVEKLTPSNVERAHPDTGRRRSKNGGGTRGGAA
jgi:16S rRNA (cytosine1402-N4)-methyltransferase